MKGPQHGLTAAHLATLKLSKEHWQAGGKRIDTSGCKTIEFRPYVPAAHGRQADMDAFRSIPSLYA